MRRKEKSLLNELEFLDSKAEDADLSLMDLDICLAVKGDLMELYLLEERNNIQKSKLNWLRMGDENTCFFHKFLAAKRR